MALTITPTVQAGTASVSLLLAGGSPEYVVTAYPAGHREYRIRSTYSPVTGAPTSRVAVDGAIPLDTPTQYVVTDSTGVQASSVLVTVTASGPLLSDATDPTRILPVTVLDQIPLEAEARSVWWTVLGRSDPFVSVAPMLYPGGTLVLYARTRDARNAIRALLLPGNPLQLRSPCPDDLDDVVLLVTRFSEALVVEDWKGGPRRLELTYQAVSDQLGYYTGDPGRTYAALLDVVPTYDGLRTAFRTYADVLTGTPYAGLSSELNVDGGFTAGTGAAWDTFWSSSGLTRTWTGTSKADAPGDNVARTSSMANHMVGETTPGCPIPVGVTKIRLTGRVRCTDPGASVKLEVLTNNSGTGNAQYFAPGSTVASTVLSGVGPAWSTFVVEVSLPGVGINVARWFYRVDALQDPAAVQTIEWDDLSARWVL